MFDGDDAVKLNEVFHRLVKLAEIKNTKRIDHMAGVEGLALEVLKDVAAGKLKGKKSILEIAKEIASAVEQ